MGDFPLHVRLPEELPCNCWNCSWGLLVGAIECGLCAKQPDIDIDIEYCVLVVYVITLQ